jgi:hypothetical protein
MTVTWGSTLSSQSSPNWSYPQDQTSAGPGGGTKNTCHLTRPQGRARLAVWQQSTTGRSGRRSVPGRNRPQGKDVTEESHGHSYVDYTGVPTPLAAALCQCLSVQGGSSSLAAALCQCLSVQGGRSSLAAILCQCLSVQSGSSSLAAALCQVLDRQRGGSSLAAALCRCLNVQVGSRSLAAAPPFVSA